MAIEQSRVALGMHVLDVEGGKLGRVKEVRPSDFKIDRRHAPDVYVRFCDVEAVDGDTVKLKLGAGQVDDQSWIEGP